MVNDIKNMNEINIEVKIDFDGTERRRDLIKGTADMSIKLSLSDAVLLRMIELEPEVLKLLLPVLLKKCEVDRTEERVVD